MVKSYVLYIWNGHPTHIMILSNRTNTPLLLPLQPAPYNQTNTPKKKILLPLLFHTNHSTKNIKKTWIQVANPNVGSSSYLGPMKKKHIPVHFLCFVKFRFGPKVRWEARAALEVSCSTSPNWRFTDFWKLLRVGKKWRKQRTAKTLVGGGRDKKPKKQKSFLIKCLLRWISCDYLWLMNLYFSLETCAH